jgi:hypothetical protein
MFMMNLWCMQYRSFLWYQWNSSQRCFLSNDDVIHVPVRQHKHTYQLLYFVITLQNFSTVFKMRTIITSGCHSALTDGVARGTRGRLSRVVVRACQYIHDVSMASTRPGGLRGTGLLHHMAAAAAAERTMLESTRDPYRSSREDYAGSHACASAKNNPTLAADGDLCFRFIIASYCPRVHVFLPTSKVPHRFTTKKKKEKKYQSHTRTRIHSFRPGKKACRRSVRLQL